LVDNRTALSLVAKNQFSVQPRSGYFPGCFFTGVSPPLQLRF
jgi:hypothetical protein